MKKIFLLPLMLCFVNSAFSKGCIIENCRGKGNDCLGAYDFVVGAENSPSEAYICETGRCEDATVIVSPDLEKAFVCEIKKGWDNIVWTGDDKWVSYIDKIQWCNDEQIRILKGKDVHGNWLFKNNDETAYRKKTIVNTTNVDYHSKNDSGSAIVFSSKNICFAWTCEYGFTPDAEGTKCVEKPAQASCTGADEMLATEDIDVISVCPNCSKIKTGDCVNKDMFACYKAMKNNTVSGLKIDWSGLECQCHPVSKYDWNKSLGMCVAKQQGGLCEQLKTKKASQARLNCCYAGNATTWNGSDTSTDVNNCVCVDQSKKWDGSACVAKINSFDNSECKYVANSYINCGNGKRIINHSEFTISAAELAGKSCKEFKAGKDMIAYIREKYCGVSGYTEEIPMDAKTKTAISNMEAFFKTSDDDVTVWRNEEGKFNTARLASDATAGVVLGTVGGVVSAKVIKKKQLEKGYDVLKCTVGGQKMADWGDVFNVGFRR